MNARGSIFFYILLCVVLFAALSYAVMNMIRGGGDYGAVEVARLQAHAAVEYADKAKTIVQDMRLSGTEAQSLSFLQSADVGYNVAPHAAKVFHPSGGGLTIPNLTDMLATATLTPAAGAYMDRMAVDDVGTSADDIVFSIRGIQKGVCEQINKNLLGSTTIPSTGANNHNALFVTGASDLSAALCASCAGVKALCVSQTGPTIYTFYSVVDPN